MDRLSRRDPKVVSPPDTIFKRKGIKIPFTACEVDGLDRGTIEVRQRSDWLLVGLSSVTTMEKKMGILKSVFGPTKDEIWT